MDEDRDIDIIRDLMQVERGDFMPGGDAGLVQRIAAGSPLLIWRALETAYALGWQAASETIANRASGIGRHADARLALIRDSMKEA